MSSITSTLKHYRFTLFWALILDVLIIYLFSEELKAILLFLITPPTAGLVTVMPLICALLIPRFTSKPYPAMAFPTMLGILAVFSLSIGNNQGWMLPVAIEFHILTISNIYLHHSFSNYETRIMRKIIKNIEKFKFVSLHYENGDKYTVRTFGKWVRWESSEKTGKENLMDYFAHLVDTHDKPLYNIKFSNNENEARELGIIP
jgi:hypothetical protein